MGNYEVQIYKGILSGNEYFRHHVAVVILSKNREPLDKLHNFLSYYL